MKNYGRYTATAAKVLKESDRIICNIAPDGTIVIVNGNVLFTMTGAEYAAIVQPVTCCEAGNWEITKTGRHDTTMNFLKVWADTVEAVNGSGVLDFAPIVRICDKTEIVGAWDAPKESVYLYNRRYIGAIDAAAAFRARDAVSPVVAFSGDQPFAMVLPISSKKSLGGLNMVRAVRAWYTAPEEIPAQVLKETETIRAALAESESARLAAEDTASAARCELAEAREELKRAAARIEELEAQAAQAAPAPAAQDPAATEAETIESIVSRFTSIPGIIATVKGAQTDAPVIWLTGDIEAQADAIRQQGGKWSAKRAAYYFRVA